MPASENTWRDMKTLHMVFGVSGLLLFIATVLLFAADHQREWKRYQRTMRTADVRLTSWQAASERTRSGAKRIESIQGELAKAQANVPDEPTIRSFIASLADPGQGSRVESTYTQLKESDSANLEDRTNLRADLLSEMNRLAQLARFDETSLLTKRKFKSADYDKARADYDLAIRDSLTEKLPSLQAIVDQVRAEREQLTLDYQAAATRRKSLDAVIRTVNTDVDALKKQLDDAQSGYKRLATALSERKVTYFQPEFPFLGKRWLELPILDAFNSPLKIDNLWTKNLTMPNGSFGTVRRFDRCTTCHKGIERTAPGSAVDPLYGAAEVVEVDLMAPTEIPPADEGDEEAPASEATAADASAEAATKPLTTMRVFGLDLANTGLIDAGAVTVRQVLPNSPAAVAHAVSGASNDGLQIGDIVRAIRGDEVRSADDAEKMLIRDLELGKPIRVLVERGLPQPFSTHPRLDLFVGSMSPHKVSVFGCTVCHEGQGSATAFKWASHSPNDPKTEERWTREYGWFNNHHWIYPMQPTRFAESTCLKCHHDVIELEASEKFAEAPAPKLMAGYHLIREYGCFGCHEINGYNGPKERLGPDMRLEPNFFAVASQLRIDPQFEKLSAETKQQVEELVHHPDRTEVRRSLLHFLKDDAKSESPVLTKASHELSGGLEDIETPGTMRKVGPSLRHVATKVGPTWLYDWIRDPTHFRPSTRMPRFFGLWDHLDPNDPAELETAQKYEQIEILGLVTYLLKASQPLELTEVGDALTENPSDEQIASGKLLFETRGCLACHQHQDFPTGKATQGPNLTNIGDKFRLDDNPDGRRWLYTWLKNPSLYHPRTKMPDLYLEPMVGADGKKKDVAADIAAYLLASSQDWKPLDDTRRALRPNRAALDGLVKEHLVAKVYIEDAAQILKEGRFPERLAQNLTGSEAYLAGELDDEKKLMYVGHRTIGKYGCYACHDIPGFETAKPIGTGLADWGRKDPSRLAFEHIAEYVGHGHGHATGKHEDATMHGSEKAAEGDANESVVVNPYATPEPADPTEPGGGPEKELDESFYMQKLTEHDRTGFVWQKLKEPRSYDFKKTRNKDSYNDRLRMPQFPFNDVQREAVVTFVLGLVAEPPATEFVYHPNPQQQALIAGQQALTKFNCVGCHIVDGERWTLEFPAGSFAEQPSDPSQTFPFMAHSFTSEETALSKTPHRTRGTYSATIHGMPEITSADGRQRVLDEEGDEVDPEQTYDPTTLIYPFEIWSPTVLEGNTYQTGITPLEIKASWVKSRMPARGGDLTKFLMTRAVEIEKQANPQADGKQVYGWLPPPLVGEGAKVQTDWLHEFLLNPRMIRPASFLRMPKFNMSSQEASDLVNYFAAKDQVAYPYSATDANDVNRLQAAEADYAGKIKTLPADQRPKGATRFDHVMNIVTSSNYCVQCHIVGDFNPKTSDRAKAPDLSDVHRRLRPNYVRRWIANPKQILPYTPMPVNVKYNANDAEHFGGVEQTLYHGTSIEQVDALVDLLINFPRYSQSRAKVADIVPPAAGTPAGTTGQADDNQQDEQGGG